MGIQPTPQLQSLVAHLFTRMSTDGTAAQASVGFDRPHHSERLDGDWKSKVPSRV
jgi:hypothetical protein